MEKETFGIVPFQLKSNPSDKEESEAQSQLKKSDEIQRLVAEAHKSFDNKDYVTASSQLDVIIEVSDITFFDH